VISANRKAVLESGAIMAPLIPVPNDADPRRGADTEEGD